MTLKRFIQQSQTFSAPRVGNLVNRDFSSLQNTRVEADKQPFSSFSYVQNAIHKGGNAVVRKGYSLLNTATTLLGIDIYEVSSGNLLYGFKKDSTNTKIVNIDREDGSETDVVTGLSGQLEPDSISLNGFFYFCNGNASVGTYDVETDTTGTVALNGTEKCKLLTADQSRVWGAFFDANIGGELLRFSNLKNTGVVTTFVQSGTNLDRAGLADSYITKFTALVGAGKYIVATSANRTEVHRIPEFGQVSSPVFTTDIGTLVWSFPKLGVPNKNGIVAIDSDVYLNPGDGTIVKINVETGSKKVYRDNQRQLERFNQEESALGYDQRNNLLLISCRTNTRNNKVVAFNIQEENFSLFTNIFAKQWAQDKDNIYFLDPISGVNNAFGSDQHTDGTELIEAIARTQVTDFGTQEVAKIVNRFYANIENYEQTTALISIYADKRVNGNFDSPAITATIELDYNPAPLAPYTQAFGGGVWGGAGTDPNFQDGEERVITSDFLNVLGVRFEMEFKVSVQRPFSIRGLGMYYFETAKPTNTLIYKS